MRPRGRDRDTSLEAPRLFDATGTGDPLETRLARARIARGLASPHPTGLGLDSDPTGLVRSAGAEPTGRLGALGPAARGRTLESTAFREIRVQATRFAETWIGPPS